MSSFKLGLLFLAIIFISRPVQADDEEDNLFQGLNTYRTSLNLSTFAKNDNAECLAEQIAEQYKGQKCTNTTGSNTVPGTENQLPNYPDLLSHCHLNLTNTRDGAILPACVPGLEQSIVLSNFTKSQYSSYFNDSKYTGAGIESDGDWIVVVLTTNTSDGSFVTSTGEGFVSNPGGLVVHFLSLFMGCLFLL